MDGGVYVLFNHARASENADYVYLLFFLHVVFIILKNICIHMFMYIYKVPDTVHKAKYHSYNLYNIVFIHKRNL